MSLLLLPGIGDSQCEATGFPVLCVLRDERPVYFFGKAFMGALDGYLAAPIYWILGAWPARSSWCQRYSRS